MKKKKMKTPPLGKRLLAYMLFIVAVFLATVSYQQWRVDQKRHWEQAQHVEAITLNRSLSGNYLAARFAASVDDLHSASYYYDHSLDATKDKEFVMQHALPAAIGAGDLAQALRLAGTMDLNKPSLNAQLGVMAVLVDGFKRQDAEKVAKNLPLMRDDGFGRLLSPLIVAWASVLQNKPEEGIARLNQMEKDYPTVRPLVNAQKALIYEVGKKPEQAEKYFLQSLDDNLSLRSAWMIGQFYERQGNRDKALDIYRKMSEKIPDATLSQMALQRIQDDGLNKNPVATVVGDGVAAALYDVASVLYQESSPRMAVLYGQLAYYLTPQDPFVNLLLGDIFASSMVRNSAEAYYRSAAETHDLSVLAQLRLASLYESVGQTDEALDILQELRKNDLTKRQATTEIADMYRRQEEFSKAIPYYDEVIAGIDKPKESDWPIYYARAICLERGNKLEASEDDLHQALQLSPDQPEVLNYLAYTWADHGKNLDKALQMLQRALAGSPQDPYITDSVGWALYRLGRFEEAIPYLDTAAQGLPDDMTVNDHLGDAYWRVGRRLEAQFQWKRALKGATDKEKSQADAIRKKLIKGLPETSLTENIKTKLRG